MIPTQEQTKDSMLLLSHRVWMKSTIRCSEASGNFPPAERRHISLSALEMSLSQLWRLWLKATVGVSVGEPHFFVINFEFAQNKPWIGEFCLVLEFFCYSDSSSWWKNIQSILDASNKVSADVLGHFVTDGGNTVVPKGGLLSAF